MLLGLEEGAEGGVDGAGEGADVGADAVEPEEALAQACGGEGWEEGGVVRREEEGLEVGSAEEGAEGAAGVAALVVVELVAPGPQERVGGDGGDEEAAGAEEVRRGDDGGAVGLDVLEDVGEDHGVAGGGFEGEVVRERAGEDRVGEAALGGEGAGVG